MHIRIDHAQPDDAQIIAQMAGSKAFGFHQEGTEARAQSWPRDGKYIVLLARDGVQPEPLGFLALYESYALYTEGAYARFQSSMFGLHIDRMAWGRNCWSRRGGLGNREDA